MANKGIKVFFSLSILFYILVILYLIIGLYNVRSFSQESASVSSSQINTAINSAFSIDYSFSSPYFRQKLSQLFAKYENLEGVIISTGENGLEYLKFRKSSLVKDFKPGGPVPVPDTSELFNKVFSAKLYFNKGRSADVVSVFNVLDRGDIFPILRNAMIVSLVHLLLSVILLTVYNSRSPAKLNTRPSVNSAAADEIDDIVENMDDDFEPDEPHVPESLPAIETPEDAPAESEPRVKPGRTSGLYSDRSGLVWEHFLPEKLDAELKRAASFDQDSCLVFLRIVNPSGYIPYRNISELIIEHFTYKDLAFESGDDTFCIIIPDRDIDDGQFEVEKFKKSLMARFPDSSFRIYAGITSRNSRLLSQKRMMQEARAALAKALSEKEGATIAFRTDLNKYREYIASIT